MDTDTERVTGAEGKGEPETEGEGESREDLVEVREGTFVPVRVRLLMSDLEGLGEEEVDTDTLADFVPVAVVVRLEEKKGERVPGGVFVEVVEKERSEVTEGNAVGVFEEEELRLGAVERENVRVGRGEEEEDADLGPVAVALEDLEFVELEVKVFVLAEVFEVVVLGVTVLVPVVVFVAVFVVDPELVDCPVPVEAMEGFTPTYARSRGSGVASTRERRRL